MNSPKVDDVGGSGRLAGSQRACEGWGGIKAGFAHFKVPGVGDELRANKQKGCKDHLLKDGMQCERVDTNQACFCFGVQHGSRKMPAGHRESAVRGPLGR